MSRKFRRRSRQISKLGMKTILVASAICASGIMVASLFLINYFREEPTIASTNPMVVAEITVFQENDPILKGSIMQNVLGIKIRANGNTNKLNLVSFEFTSRGTSKPVEQNICNARLWNTGNQEYFTPNRQLGAALNVIPDGTFIMNGGIPLHEGENFFWLTFDILGNQSPSKLSIDAELISANIGTLVYNPDRVALNGTKEVLSNVPYYSVGNGDISALSTWNSRRDGAGKQPSSFNEPNATFFIQSGHILTNTVSGCIPAILIERNGVLKSTTILRSDLLDIQPGGTYIQEKDFENSATLKKLIIRDQGNYLHLNKGPVPGKQKQFAPHSTVVLNQYSDVTFSDSVVWGNLIIDAIEAQTANAGRGLRTIKGNLEIRATGKDGYLCTTASDTINIAGNMTIAGGRLVLAPVANSTTMVIGGQLIIDKGWLSDVLPGKNSKGNVHLVPGTLVLLRSGTFHFNGSGSQIICISPQIVWSQLNTDVILPDVEILQGSSLTIRGEKMGNLPREKTIRIKRDGTFNTGNAVIQGAGKFILEDFASLSTEHPDGINSSNAKGCIQTASTYFSSNANYIYKGSSSPQMMGDFKTIPDDGVIASLTISKERISDIVMLEKSWRIKGRLIQQRGNINKNSHEFEYGEKSKTAIAIP